MNFENYRFNIFQINNHNFSENYSLNYLKKIISNRNSIVVQNQSILSIIEWIKKNNFNNDILNSKSYILKTDKNLEPVELYIHICFLQTNKYLIKFICKENRDYRLTKNDYNYLKNFKKRISNLLDYPLYIGLNFDSLSNVNTKSIFSKSQLKNPVNILYFKNSNNNKWEKFSDFALEKSNTEKYLLNLDLNNPWIICEHNENLTDFTICSKLSNKLDNPNLPNFINSDAEIIVKVDTEPDISLLKSYLISEIQSIELKDSILYNIDIDQIIKYLEKFSFDKKIQFINTYKKNNSTSLLEIIPVDPGKIYKINYFHSHPINESKFIYDSTIFSIPVKNFSLLSMMMIEYIKSLKEKVFPVSFDESDILINKKTSNFKNKEIVNIKFDDLQTQKSLDDSSNALNIIYNKYARDFQKINFSLSVSLGPFDVFIQVIFLAIQLGENFKKIYIDNIIPYMKSELERGSGGFGDKISSKLRSFRRKYYESFFEKYGKNPPISLLEKSFENIEKQSERERNKAIKKLQAYTFDEIAMIPEPLIYEILKKGLFSRRQILSLYSKNILSKNELDEYLEIQGSKSIDNFIRISSNYNEIQYLYDKYTENGEIEKIGVIVTASIIVLLALTTAAIGVGGFVTTKVIESFIKGLKNDTGIVGKSKRIYRNVKNKIKTQYLMRFKGMTKEEIKKVLSKDVEDSLNSLNEQGMLRKARSFSFEEWDALDRENLGRLYRTEFIPVFMHEIFIAKYKENHLEELKESDPSFTFENTIYDPEFRNKIISEFNGIILLEPESMGVDAKLQLQTLISKYIKYIPDCKILSDAIIYRALVLEVLSVFQVDFPCREEVIKKYKKYEKSNKKNKDKKITSKYFDDPFNIYENHLSKYYSVWFSDLNGMKINIFTIDQPNEIQSNYGFDNFINQLIMYIKSDINDNEEIQIGWNRINNLIEIKTNFVSIHRKNFLFLECLNLFYKIILYMKIGFLYPINLKLSNESQYHLLENVLFYLKDIHFENSRGNMFQITNKKFWENDSIPSQSINKSNFKLTLIPKYNFKKNLSNSYNNNEETEGIDGISQIISRG